MTDVNLTFGYDLILFVFPGLYVLFLYGDYSAINVFLCTDEFNLPTLDRNEFKGFTFLYLFVLKFSNAKGKLEKLFSTTSVFKCF
jgi:hypothetical protein